jgi:two-component system nitrogen regulation response regulator GlnG
VVKSLEKYHWPGNVRELENVIRRALVVAKGQAFLASDLPGEIIGDATATAVAASTGTATDSSPSEIVAMSRQLFQWARRDPKMKVIPTIERELVIQALKETKGNQVHAAKLLGITRATLRKRVEKFGIQKELSIK